MLKIILNLTFIVLALQLVAQDPFEKRYANGNILLSGTMLQGEKHGIWKEYTEQGKLLSYTQYEMGKKIYEKIYDKRMGHLRLENYYAVHPQYGYVKEYTKDGICWKEQYGRIGNSGVQSGYNHRDAWGPHITRSTKSGKLNYYSYFVNLPFKPELKIEFPLYNFAEEGHVIAVTLNPQSISWHVDGKLAQIRGNLTADKQVNYRWNKEGQRVNNMYKPILNDTFNFDFSWTQNQLQYTHEDGMPQGKWVNYYPNGSIWFTQSFKEGKLHGRYESYYINGQKRYEMDFSEGLLHGSFYEWYENGTLKASGSFNQGMLNGEWAYWSKDKVQMASESWKDNRKDGRFRKWTEEGILVLDENYTEDKLQGRKKMWHPNGALKIDMYAHNQYQEGLYLEYADNGQLIKEYYYNHGLTISYTKEGQMASIGYQNHDNASTLRIRWEQGEVFDMNYHWSNNDYAYVHFKGGEIHEIRYRKGDKTLNDKLPFDFMKDPKDISFEWQGSMLNEKREGLWQMNYPNGRLWIRQYYKKGDLEGPMEVFNMDGQMIERTVFSRNKKNGLSQIWDDKGTLIGEYHFFDNRKEGVQKQWHPNGQLKSINTYQRDIHHGEFVSYDLNGKINSHSNYQNGKRHGINKYYKYPEGYLWAETTYEDGLKHGEYRLYHPNGTLRTQGSFLKDKKHGTWYTYDDKGTNTGTSYFYYGEKKAEPSPLACPCDANYMNRGKSVFFNPVDSYIDYPKAVSLSNEYLLIPERVLDRTYSRKVYPDFRHHYGGISMDMMNFDTLYFYHKLAPHMRLVLNPCLGDNEISHTPIRVHYSHPIKQYVPDFDEAEFQGTALEYFNLALNMISYDVQTLLDGYIRIKYNGNDWTEDQYKSFVKNLYKKKVLTKEQYKQKPDPEQLEEIIDDLEEEAYQRFEDFIFDEVFSSYTGANIYPSNPAFERDFIRFFPRLNANTSLKSIQRACKLQYDATVHAPNLAVDIPVKLLKQLDKKTGRALMHKGKESPARFLFEGTQVQFNNLDGLYFSSQNLQCFSPALIGNTSATIHTLSATIYTEEGDLSRYRNLKIPEDIPAGIYISNAGGTIRLNLKGNEYACRLTYDNVFLNGEHMEATFHFATESISSITDLNAIRKSLPKEWTIKDIKHDPQTKRIHVHFAFKA